MAAFSTRTGHLDAARNVATGVTLFGNPLSAAAAKAALTEVLVLSAYRHTASLAVSSPTASVMQSGQPGCHGQ